MNKMIKILARNNINLKAFDCKEFKNKIYNTLKEFDIFKNDYYHQIFYFTYILKYPKTQTFIAMELGMDQSTVSRKQKEIENYIIKKIKI